MKKSLVLGLLLALVIGAWAGGSNPAAGDADAFLKTTTNRANNGTTNGFDAVTASNIVSTVATFTNLTVVSSAAIATNTSPVAYTQSPFLINIPYTNGAGRAFVAGSIRMPNVTGAAAQTELRKVSGTIVTIDACGVGSSSTNTCPLTGIIGPGDIIVFTNTVGAVGVMSTNSITQL